MQQANQENDAINELWVMRACERVEGLRAVQERNDNDSVNARVGTNLRESRVTTTVYIRSDEAVRVSREMRVFDGSKTRVEWTCQS